jgi:hypothetical protein
MNGIEGPPETCLRQEGITLAFGENSEKLIYPQLLENIQDEYVPGRGEPENCPAQGFFYDGDDEYEGDDE